MKKRIDGVAGASDDGNDRVSGGDAGGGLSVRDEFVLRCLNAAVNLYGIITAKDFCEIYNGYAKNHAEPISAPLTEDEAVNTVRRLLQKEDDEELDVLYEDVWFSLLRDDGTGAWLFIYEAFTNELSDEYADTVEPIRSMRVVMRKISENRAKFSDVPLKILPEKTFLLYEDPLGDEVTPEAKKYLKFVKQEYGVTKSAAEFDTFRLVADLRIGGASLANALEYISAEFDYAPEDEAGLRRLMDAISPVIGTTRTWQYRGHTQHEMYELGKIDKYAQEDIPDYFGIFDDDDCNDDDDEQEDDDYLVDDDEEGEPVRVEDLPPAKLTGLFDFKSVKDEKVRERLLWEYEGVRLATRDFVRREVMREMTKEERGDAAKRLGFPIDPKTGFIADRTLDCVAGDYAAMMDDQHGEPAIKRVLNRKDTLKDALDRAAAEYYENYRYTWLEIQAVKAGVGVKCRDLMTGEDVFLMEMNLSQSDVKGMTACVGIAPMGEVYLSLGVVHPAHFENPAAILKIVLAHLGLPTEPPIRLSFADQARFAAETIRRINANGKFGEIFYGGTV